MTSRGLPPLFGAPWERSEEDEQAIERAGARKVQGELAWSARAKASRENLNLWRQAERASEKQMSHIIRRELSDAKVAGNELRALLVEITRLGG